MSRNKWEDALQAVLTGGLQGYQAGREGQQDAQKMIMESKLKSILEPKEWKPRSMEEAIQFEQAKIGAKPPTYRTVGNSVISITPTGEVSTIAEVPETEKEKLDREKTQIIVDDLKNKQEESKDVKEKHSQMVVESAIDFKDTIAKVKAGIKYFGPPFGRVPTLNPFATDRVEWEANINKLLSQKIVDLMNTMKQASRTGATGFGQLNRSELLLLQRASTALNRGLNPTQALEYLNKLETASDKIINGKVESITGIKQLPDLKPGYERRKYKNGTIKDVPIGS